MISVDIQILKETVETGYKVTFTAINAQNMTPKIFVVTKATNAYDRVASFWDLGSVPEDPMNGLSFIRVATFTKTFPFTQLYVANSYVENIPKSVDRLVAKLEDYPFTGTDTISIPIV